MKRSYETIFQSVMPDELTNQVDRDTNIVPGVTESLAPSFWFHIC